MRESSIIKNSLFWEWRCLTTSLQFYIYLILSGMYYLLLALLNFFEVGFGEYLLKGPGLDGIETISLLSYLLFQAQNIFLLQQLFFGLSITNFNLTILRIGSIKDWFLVKLISLIFLSLLLGLFQTVPLFFIGDMGYLFFLHFFVVNSTNFILFSSLLFLLFHFDFSDAVSFCITYSLLVFIIFSGEILGENTNYFVTILARVAEYEKNSNLSLFIAIFFELILSAAILSFIKIRYSLGGKIHE
ncbi:TPA: hypothetical protein ACGO4K_000273 [Streptococcus suis]